MIVFQPGLSRTVFEEDSRLRCMKYDTLTVVPDMEVLGRNIVVFSNEKIHLFDSMRSYECVHLASAPALS